MYLLCLLFKFQKSFRKSKLNYVKPSRSLIAFTFGKGFESCRKSEDDFELVRCFCSSITMVIKKDILGNRLTRPIPIFLLIQFSVWINATLEERSSLGSLLKSNWRSRKKLKIRKVEKRIPKNRKNQLKKILRKKRESWSGKLYLNKRNFSELLKILTKCFLWSLLIRKWKFSLTPIS